MIMGHNRCKLKVYSIELQIVDPLRKGHFVLDLSIIIIQGTLLPKHYLSYTLHNNYSIESLQEVDDFAIQVML